MALKKIKISGREVNNLNKLAEESKVKIKDYSVNRFGVITVEVYYPKKENLNKFISLTK